MKPMILTDILYVKEDALSKGHPYIPAACRRCHSLAIITEGRMRYTVNNCSLLLSCGDILFIRAGSMDRAETATESPVRYITVDFCSLEAEEDMNTFYRREDKNLLPLFVRLLSVFQRHGENRLMEGLEILYSILNTLRQSDEHTLDQKDLYLRISKAVEAVRDRMNDPSLTVKDMAEVCGVSTVTLNRCFREVYRMTASDYLLDRRMQLAKTLLLNSVNSVGDVAKEAGYGDIYAFSHAFARCFGVSPSAWRIHPDQP